VWGNTAKKRKHETKSLGTKVKRGGKKAERGWASGQRQLTWGGSTRNQGLRRQPVLEGF